MVYTEIFQRFKDYPHANLPRIFIWTLWAVICYRNFYLIVNEKWNIANWDSKGLHFNGFYHFLLNRFYSIYRASIRTYITPDNHT